MLNNIHFEDKYISPEYGTTTYYFIAPKEMLLGKYPEADRMTISIEVLTNHENADYATVQFSPTMYDKVGKCIIDYDWFDGDLSHEEIEELLALAKGKQFNLASLIHEKINEIFLAYQKANNIPSGDISSLDAIELDNIEDALYLLIKRIYERK